MKKALVMQMGAITTTFVIMAMVMDMAKFTIKSTLLGTYLKVQHLIDWVPFAVRAQVFSCRCAFDDHWFSFVHPILKDNT